MLRCWDVDTLIGWGWCWDVEMLRRWDVETVRRWDVEMLRRCDAETGPICWYVKMLIESWPHNISMSWYVLSHRLICWSSIPTIDQSNSLTPQLWAWRSHTELRRWVVESPGVEMLTLGVEQLISQPEMLKCRVDTLVLWPQKLIFHQNC